MSAMKNFLLIIVALTAFDLSAGTDISQEIAGLVQSLGLKDDRAIGTLEKQTAIINRLTKFPQRAVPRLVRELHPISIAKLDEKSNSPKDNAAALHVVWCLRALYFMTGTNFFATTHYKFSNSEIDDNRSGLLFRKTDRLCFFIEWMSRGSVYFAPEDTQREIIKQWNEWLRASGRNWKFRTTAKLDDWYFSGPEPTG